MEIAQLSKNTKIISCCNPHIFVIREILPNMAGKSTSADPRLKATL